MKGRMRKRTKNGVMLMTVAESIGSTLATIAGKADAAQKTLIPSGVLIAIEREGRKLLRKSRGVARKTRQAKNAAARNVTSSKLVKTVRQ